MLRTHINSKENVNYFTNVAIQRVDVADIKGDEYFGHVWQRSKVFDTTWCKTYVEIEAVGHAGWNDPENHEGYSTKAQIVLVIDNLSLNEIYNISKVVDPGKGLPPMEMLKLARKEAKKIIKKYFSKLADPTEEPTEVEVDDYENGDDYVITNNYIYRYIEEEDDDWN